MYSPGSSTSSGGSSRSRTSSSTHGSRLPSYLSNVIRKTSDHGVEMQFPLSKMPELQRQGIGIGDAEALLVRFTPGSKYTSQGYCVHLSDEDGFCNEAHTPWQIFRQNQAPDRAYCRGIPSLATYQLSRILWRHLQVGFVSLEHIYLSIVISITKMAEMCVVCGCEQSMHLRRSTTCGNPRCAAVFSAADFEIHVGDMWTDPRVVDLLFTAAHAATLSTAILTTWNRSTAPVTLLKGCPIGNAALVASMLDRLPTVHTLGNTLAQDLETLKSSSLRSNTLAKTFLWACTSHEGFLTEAIGQYHIPGFRSAPQFLLANASLRLEERFAVQLEEANGNSCVMFHGTSLDRLQSILRNGLRICTGTPLMIHRATSGPGVYMTSEPGQAADFATPTAELPIFSNTRSSQLRKALSGRQNSAFRNQGVLLACEVGWPRHATKSWADWRGRGHIWCVREPANIMVRYVFLVKSSTPIPKGRDVEPYFAKAFKQLKMGL